MKMLVRAEDIRNMDETAQKVCHISMMQMMEHAALAVYEEIIIRIPKGKQILIVCGRGNNGGDGFALARLLDNAYIVQIYCPYEDSLLTSAALQEKQICDALRIPVFTDLKDFKKSACKSNVIVDGLFGTGLQRDITGVEKSCINIINDSEAYVISIDIPSGVHSDTGSCMNAAVAADLSITFTYAKRGMYLYPGYEYCGEIIVKDIHIPKYAVKVIQPVFILDEDCVAAMLPKRVKHSHKGSYGKALLIGGSASMHGAVELAASACLHSGIGTLTCMIPEDISTMLGGKLSEAMLRCEPSNDGFMCVEAASDLQSIISDYDVIGIGCGAGRTEATFQLLRTVLISDRPCVVDADALYMLKDHLELLNRDAPVILTPHPKEMSYLCKEHLQDVLLHPIETAFAFIKDFPSVVLILKGEHTLIIQQDSIYMNIRGNHGLAKGGSGDILCGTILGFLGQSLQAVNSACSGVFVHACAAEELMKTCSGYAMLPSMLPEAYRKIFHKLTDK